MAVCTGLILGMRVGDGLELGLKLGRSRRSGARVKSRDVCGGLKDVAKNWIEI
jgi:hypothetical protein